MLIEKLIDSLDLGRVAPDNPQIKMLGERENFANLTKCQESLNKNLDEYIYDSIEKYRNFLDWLFETFNTSEGEFRRSCVVNLQLKSGSKALVTGCGLGGDVEVLCMIVGETGVVHGQDLNYDFVEYAGNKTKYTNSIFTISNALDLPYKDNYFDGVFHFGGINLFGDVRLAVAEMSRVCKVGGRVLFGDESVAEHLRELDYGKIAIKNNPLWATALPLNKLPINALNIFVRYVLGNCFYLIGFDKGEGLPNISLDVPHIGYRGGSMRTRFFGEVEGVELNAKEKLYKYAKDNNTSVHTLLTMLVNKHLN